jgi:hypothetical protein
MLREGLNASYGIFALNFRVRAASVVNHFD